MKTMAFNCMSLCVPFVTGSPTISSATITSQLYNCPSVTPVNPQPLTVSVIRQILNGVTTYFIAVGPAIGSFFIDSDVSYSIVNLKIGRQTSPAILNWGSFGEFGTHPTPCGPVNNALTTSITLQRNNYPSFPDTPYKVGDFYEINVASCCNGNINNLQVNFMRPAVATFTNIVPRSMINTCSNCTACQQFIDNTCENIRVPIVSIIGQTTIDGSDVGDVIFTICDEFTYYKDEKISTDNMCAVIYINHDQIKQTVFNQCCPFMVSVLRGHGLTLQEKAANIFAKISSTISVSFVEFYDNIILYGMAKYILSRILYGNFDINYLLGKYNDKFLRDLDESRFCSFVQFFNDCESSVYGYNKYFKFGEKHH